MAMWFIASLFYAYQYIIRVLPNILMPEIMDKFHISAAIFGQFSGVYYLTYAGLHIPVGLMLDRWGAKRVLPLCITATFAGLLPLIYTDIWAYPVIGRALIGFGSSGAILGAFKIIRMGFPEHQFTRMLGISVTIGLLGALYGGQPVHYLLKILGWEQVIQILVLVGIVLAIAAYLVIPKETAQHSSQSSFGMVKEVFSNRKVIFVCLLGGLMVGPLEGFADAWGQAFLKSVYVLEDGVAARIPSIMYLGMCFGSPLLSYWADRSQAHLKVVAFAGWTMGLGFLFLLVGGWSVNVLSVLFFIIGFMCAYQISVIYKASTFVSPNLAGLTTSCANMIIMLFGYVFHSSIGVLLDMSATAPHVYSATDFSLAIAVIPAGCLIGAACFTVYSWRLRISKTAPIA